MLHENKIRNIVAQIKNVFICELGWDNYNIEFIFPEINSKEKVFSIAEKRGFGIFLCRKEQIENLTQFQKELNKLIYENIIVFIGEESWTWQISDTEHVQRVHTPVGFIPSIKFNLEDEGNIYITDVCKKVGHVFKKAEKHKSFYKAINIGEQSEWNNS